MPTFSATTGTSGVMEIRDDGREYVELWLRADTTSLIPDLPWSYTVDGVRQSWRPFEFARNGYWQRLGIIRVLTSQSITFSIGESGDANIGGPTDFIQYIGRSQVPGTVRVQVGNEVKSAIPYVKVGGVWRQAEPWVKDFGTWKQTT